MSFKKSHPFKQNQPKLLITEGPTDAHFFRSLRDANRIPNDITVRTTGDIGPGGWQGLENYLSHIVALPNFKNYIGTIIIVFDSDDDAAVRLGEIRDIIIRVNQRADTENLYSVPDTLGSLAEENPINTAIYLLPDNQNSGCLEGLLYGAYESQNPDSANCVEQFLLCADTRDWLPRKINKAKVTSGLSVVLSEDPSCSLVRLWKDYPDAIPITSSEFDDISTFLSGL